MKLKKDRVRSLSRVLCRHLLDSGAIRFSKSEEMLAGTIEQIITDELRVEDRLEVEARRILESYESQIQAGNMDPHQMLQMIKKQLAKDQDIIL